MHVVVLGSTGLLGSDVVMAAAERGWTLETPSREEVDLRDERTLDAFFLGTKPDWIINCAAYTGVDKAEEERDEAFLINARGAYLVSRFAARARARLLHVSTDFVFDGSQRRPYTEDDPTNPLGAYGQSKRLGEELILEDKGLAVILRTAWLFGVNGKCFPKTILNAALQGKTLRVVSDQIGSPTFTADAAGGICDLIEADPVPGVYHLVNTGEASWHDLAVACLREWGLQTDIEAIATADWPTPAKRPPYSVLSMEKYRSLGLASLRNWKDAVTAFISELKTSGFASK
jgi:dTDP-4-dehydrorhamnose reductase